METKDPEVCQLGEEPCKNTSDGSSIEFLVVLCSSSVFSSPSSLLSTESVCGLTAASQETNSGVLHEMTKINQACYINTNLLGYEHYHGE